MNTPAAPTASPELPDGPFDIEFFLDPLCPFAWQTSVWLRRVAELRDLRVGWRFISLFVIHEDDPDQPDVYTQMQQRGHQVHRVMAAVRERHGNDAVGDLYERWGRSVWYGDDSSSIVDAANGVDLAALLADGGLDPDLAAAAGVDSWDLVIRSETALAFERAGDDIGTPVITFGPPAGRSFFGPIISSQPSDDDALRMFDAMATLVEFPDFAELKRTNRPPLDLPALAALAS